MGTYLLFRCELFWQQARHAFAPLQQFSLMLLLVAGHALIGLWAPLVLLGFQLFNPELDITERWPYLQMLLVMLLCWQGAVAWQQKSVAEQYFVESLAPSAQTLWLSNKLMALLNQLPFWFFTLPVLIYLLLSGKTMAWLDAAQLLLVLLVLCWSFPARQTSWLALVAVFVLPQLSLWSLPLLILMLLERVLLHLFSGNSFSAGSLFRYWLYWFIGQQQNKALLLLITFVLALWQYWLAQKLKAEAVVFIHSVFIWGVALLCYAQQKLWQQQLASQHYFWLSCCTAKQRLYLKLINILPVLIGAALALFVLNATAAVWTIMLAVVLTVWPKVTLLSVAVLCFMLLLVLHGQGLWA
ncbi:hypothetical protein EIK76_02045 [Rheinheimera mesophila]|uniref:Uncharacterized protein n=1 Tax=Rheinheimera mesophila TaxID=1547515 RepID=A0A3P3QQ86_9GAMM|nr:hypothetical protein [Rheinheimera mesophila]KKL02877.1 hypothetical protein SD53_03325 [Rheinheimera mesophila]RRJ22888.1 hypothetical protein EIK76_02045 [Rheinheimera mesophila]